MFNQRINARLAHQERVGLYRNPPPIARREGKIVVVKGRRLLNFASNDYLGLGGDPALAEKVAANFKRYGASSSSSRLVSGHYDTISQAEAALAEYFGYESALFYPSGYQCNLGVIGTLFETGDTVFFDKHIHASSVKGLRLSGATFCGFRHNRMDHLARRLDRHHAPEAGLLTESLFSMDGDQLAVDDLVQLKTNYRLLTIVDEAHAFGVLGAGGKGIARPVADVAVGTFGKALGLFGAFALMPSRVREYLLNFSSPQIYTTTLPEAHGASVLDLLERVAGADDRRDRLAAISREMRSRLQQAGFDVSGDAHILAVEIGTEARAVALARALFDNGFFVFPARFPTVPLGKAILRLSLTASHTIADIDDFIHTLTRIAHDLTL